MIRIICLYSYRAYTAYFTDLYSDGTEINRDYRKLSSKSYERLQSIVMKNMHSVAGDENSVTYVVEVTDKPKSRHVTTTETMPTTETGDLPF